MKICNNKLLCLLMALLLMLSMLTGCAQETTQEETTAEEETVSTETEATEEPADESTEETEAETETTEEPVVVSDKTPMHMNAYGYPSWSVHFETAEDGSVTYKYLDENAQEVTVPVETINQKLDTVVAACGDIELTNMDLMFYYDQQYYTLSSQYGSYLSLMLDTTRNLDEQLSFQGTSTWQEDMLVASVNMFHEVASVYQEAQSVGFVLSEEDQAYLDSMEGDLTAVALQMGMESAEEYLQSYFGPGVKLQAYMDYVTLLQTASSYLTHEQEALSFSDEELNAYYDANAETLQSTYGAQKVDKNVMNVRHILITPADTESEDSWTEAMTEAERILNEWKSGEATEESFAALANEYSTDPGSNTNGGLYEEVYPGQMVQTFNDWCFDDARQVGDTGIVETDYGYHIMYYVAEGDYIYWRYVAEGMLGSEQLTTLVDDLMAGYEVTPDYAEMMILQSIAPTDPAVLEAEQAAQEEAEATGEEG